MSHARVRDPLAVLVSSARPVSNAAAGCDLIDTPPAPPPFSTVADMRPDTFRALRRRVMDRSRARRQNHAKDCRQPVYKGG